MQKYVNQLLVDLSQIQQQREKERELRVSTEYYGNDKSKYKSMFAEVDRYTSEDPKEVLGHHCGLQKIQFPKENLLSDKQCQDLTEALEMVYLAFNINANMPQMLPIKMRYKEIVELLDKKVFSDWFGMTTFEHCHYDYEGVCPFGVSHCDCWLNWKSDVEEIIEKPQSEWFDTEATEITWYKLMNRFDELNRDLGQVSTPNKLAVQKLLKQLTEARKLMKDAIVHFKTDKTEMPDGDFVPFLETLGVGEVTFPKVENLTALELELLVIALHFLFGKGYYSEYFVEWSLEYQYQEFVTHWSQWGKLDDTKDYFLFKMQPKTQTIFDKISKVSKYKSYDDHIMSLPNTPNNDNELPF